MKKAWKAYAAGLALSVFFVLLGVVFIPYAGAQYDEALFSMALYHPDHVECVMKFGSVKVPVMLMTYVGTLKAAIYAPILRTFGNSNGTLRLPSLLIGAVSVWLVFLLVRRLAGTRAAVLATVLLATDALYLLTNVFDWGPVALQHLLFAGAFYSAVRFAQERHRGWLFACSLMAGLALWDKALFVWFFAGFSVALLVIFPREIWALLKDKRSVAAAVGGLLLGAAPLIYYNKIHHLRTFTANVNPDEGSPFRKIQALDRTLDGSGLLGYLTRERAEGGTARVRLWEEAPLWITSKLGETRQSIQPLLLVCAFIAAPLLCWNGPRRKVALLIILGGLIAYLLMISSKETGGSVHHTILLWPLPQILLGLALAEVGCRWPGRVSRVAAAAVVICAFSNLLVLNTYLSQFIAFGAGPAWSDAIRPLVAELGVRPGKQIFAVDWGITQQIEYYAAGKIGFHRSSDGIVAGMPDAHNKELLAAHFAEPSNVYVTHTEGHEAFEGVRKKFLDFAAECGYRDEIVKVIQDRQGVPVFEIHELRK